MSEDTPGAAAPGPEVSREEKIAAAKAKADAIKAQRAAGASGAATPTPPVARPAAAAGVPGRATSVNPGGAPPVAPQNPKIEAFGTLTQGVELRCDATEMQNIERLLGGLGLYRNPLRGVWQLDYRYYAEARTRLRAAGYQVEGRDYLGRPLEQWNPHARGWTRLAP
ncbi:MAG TPA: hypothetical protein VKV57_07100 [bacterium]|nr:hypothetical protein [bacterium]